MSSNEPTPPAGTPGSFPWAPPPPDARVSPLLEVPNPLAPPNHLNPWAPIPQAPPSPPGPPTTPPGPPPTVRPAAHRRARRVLGWTLIVLVAAMVAGAAAVAAGSWRYAEVNRRDAEDNLVSSQQWQQRAGAQQVVVDEQVARLIELEAQIATLTAQIAELERTGASATARADGLQALLDDATRRLNEAENRVAALAGQQARAVDDRIVGR